MTTRVLALTRYGPLGSSSRLRMLQYIPALSSAGFSVDVQPLFDDATLARRYKRGGYGIVTLANCFAKRLGALLRGRHHDILWIEKEALQWWPLWFEQQMLSGTPYVLDFDDAVFHHYDMHRIGLVRSLYGKRIDGLMAHAAMVVCGNEYLAQRARRAGARHVEILPTVIDLTRYKKQESLDPTTPRIVWIGSPSTIKYLDLVGEPLRKLAQTNPFTLRVIGGDINVTGVQTECLAWSEDTESADIAACDIGIMPLTDTSWERGKCGYKLIQYMACGLPVIASPVGVNRTIVRNGHNGFLAEDAKEWIMSLQSLLVDRQRRIGMGQAGREQVEQHYCLQVIAPKLIDSFNHLVT